MNAWKPFVVRLTRADIDRARRVCMAEAREGRLVSICANCLAESGLLRDAVEGMKNLSHGICDEHMKDFDLSA